MPALLKYRRGEWAALYKCFSFAALSFMGRATAHPLYLPNVERPVLQGFGQRVDVEAHRRWPSWSTHVTVNSARPAAKALRPQANSYSGAVRVGSAPVRSMSSILRTVSGANRHVAAFGTDVGGHVVKDDHLVLVPYRMHDFSPFVLSLATLDAAFHVTVLLCTGVTHLGGFGS